jgi:hypothetical protein
MEHMHRQIWREESKKRELHECNDEAIPRIANEFQTRFGLSDDVARSAAEAIIIEGDLEKARRIALGEF